MNGCARCACAALFGALLALWAASAAGADRGAVEKKLGLVDYYLESPAAKRIRESDNSRAQDLLERARELREQAERALGDGDVALAEKNATLALRSMSSATTALNQDGGSNEELRKRNARLREEIESYRESFNQTVLDKGPAFASLLDSARVDALMADAHALSDRGDHGEASKRLREAYQLTVSAVTRLRNNETVVYSLDFRTPADEYRYEENRHQSYQLLVQQMMGAGHAEGPQGKLVERYLGEANKLAAQARGEAGGGDHVQAIATMEEANKNLVRALQMMGLAIPG